MSSVTQSLEEVGSEGSGPGSNQVEAHPEVEVSTCLPAVPIPQAKVPILAAPVSKRFSGDLAAQPGKRPPRAMSAQLVPGIHGAAVSIALRLCWPGSGQRSVGRTSVVSRLQPTFPGFFPKV